MYISINELAVKHKLNARQLPDYAFCQVDVHLMLHPESNDAGGMLLNVADEEIFVENFRQHLEESRIN